MEKGYISCNYKESVNEISSVIVILCNEKYPKQSFVLFDNPITYPIS